MDSMPEKATTEGGRYFCYAFQTDEVYGLLTRHLWINISLVDLPTTTVRFTYHQGVAQLKNIKEKLSAIQAVYLDAPTVLME